MTIYRYSGAGNSFVVIDGRNIDTTRYRKASMVRMLCALNGTDGLMILEADPECDFRMSYWNSDGSGGMMCGNGGRCITAFADVLNIHPSVGNEYRFRAADGIHTARILSHLGEMKSIRLSMKPVDGWKETPYGIFMDTGTRHLVLSVPDALSVDVASEGRRMRLLPDFGPEGTNVNFMSVMPDGRLLVRSYEKGVEAETEACGTGITAAAMAAYIGGVPPSACQDSAFRYDVRTAGGDSLSVEFRPSEGRFEDVYLVGPTLCEGEII